MDRRLQAGQAPDLFRVSYTDVGGYAPRGVLADLSSTLDASYGEEFFPPLWAAMQADGVPVGVPHHTDTSALAFNLDHLEAGRHHRRPRPRWRRRGRGRSSSPSSQQLTRRRPGRCARSPFNYQDVRRLPLVQHPATRPAGRCSTARSRRSARPSRPGEPWSGPSGLYTEGLHEPSVLVRRPTYPDEIFPTGQISMIQTGDFLIPSLEAAIDGTVRVGGHVPHAATGRPRPTWVATRSW